MRTFQILLFFSFLYSSLEIHAQTIEDDFEGNGNVDEWMAADCLINPNLPNPVSQGINTSSTVMEYFDYGGLWGNAYFTASQNFNIGAHPEFSLKIYVPSNSITGNQENVVTLKLQNSHILHPWESQATISKPIVLDQWQVVNFDFSTNNYVNFDSNSPPPISRRDFDRVLIQVNGENNTDQVRAYIDDFYYFSDTPLPPPPVYDQLVWSDEFDGEGAVDSEKWFHQTIFPVGNSWFGGELQHYTDRQDNSFLEDGILHVVAKDETFTDQGVTKEYTSARLNSKFAFKYGRIECRAKVPVGAGTLPAIWLLGKNITENGAYWETQGFGELPWPDCGEMDIMEHWGADQNTVKSAVHNPLTYFSDPGTVIHSGGQILPTATMEFHTYVLEWTPEKVEFSADGVVHYIYQPAEKNADNWPFDLEQYILLNVAVLPSIDPAFTEGALEIDYIRVYQQNNLGNSDTDIIPKAKAYPIPVNDEMNLELNSDLNGFVTFKVHNTSGSLVASFKSDVVDGKVRITGLSELSRGLYVLTYTKGNLTETVNFVR